MKSHWLRGLIIVGAVAAAFSAGWLAGRHFADTAGETKPAKNPERPAASATLAGAGDVEKLKEENAALRQQLAQIEEERKNLGRDYLQLAMKQSFESAPAKNIPPEKMRARWDNDLGKILSNGGGLFGNLEDMFNLAIEMAAHGEAGIRFMGSIANDRTRNDREREAAIQILARIRDRSAFEFLLRFRDDQLTELDYPYDLIRYQVASLPTNQISQHFAEIVRQIEADLSGPNNNPGPERAEVLVSLAAVHQDRRAQQLLSDPRMWQEDLQGAVDTARGIHNQTAYDFLRAVEQNHQDPNIRQRATSILDNW